MGQINIRHGTLHYNRMLLASTLVGRHWRCDVIINDPRVPLYWLEIRWTGDAWAWRELTDTGGTRGTGVSVSRGWRTLNDQGKKPPRVTHPPDVSMTFTDLSPCSWSVEDMTTGEHLSRADAEECVELWEGRAYRVGWEHREQMSPPLLDGARDKEGAIAYRFHAGLSTQDTSISQLDVTSAHCRLDIDADALTATFTQGSLEAHVRGEFVRTLLIYATTRRDEHFDDGGWLTRSEAHQRWLAQGGNPHSPEERIGWDRGKLRTHLAEAGASQLKHLFESTRTGSEVSIRLKLSPAQVCIA
jgi:hypothetical protein